MQIRFIPELYKSYKKLVQFYTKQRNYKQVALLNIELLKLDGFDIDQEKELIRFSSDVILYAFAAACAFKKCNMLNDMNKYKEHGIYLHSLRFGGNKELVKFDMSKELKRDKIDLDL